MSLRESTKQAWLVAQKDLRATLRSKTGIITIILAPLIMMALLGYVFPSVGKLHDIPFAVVNGDEQAGIDYSPSNQFIARFASENAAAGSFTLKGYQTEEAAKEALRTREVRGILIVPAGFSALESEGTQTAHLTVLYDQSDPTLGRLVAGEAGRIISKMGEDQVIANVQSQTRYQTDASAETFLRPYTTDVKGATDVSPSYFQFLAPGLMTLMAVGAVMTGLPSSFNSEKSKGTLDTLLVAPIGRWTLILGKVIAQLVRGVIQAAILFTLAMLLFGVRIGGSLPLAALILVLTLLAFVGLGVLLTALVASDEGSGMGTILYLPSLLISGVIFPVEQLPVVIQWVSKLMPLTYAVVAMRKVMILGAGFGDVLPEILILCAFGVVSFLFAGRAFRRAFTQ